MVERPSTTPHLPDGYRRLEQVSKDEKKLQAEVDRLTAAHMKDLLSEQNIHAVRAISRSVWDALYKRAEVLKKEFSQKEYEKLLDNLDRLHERIDDDLAQRLLEALATNPNVSPDVREATLNSLEVGFLVGGLLGTHADESDRAGLTEKTDEDALPDLFGRTDITDVKVHDLVTKGLSVEVTWDSFFKREPAHGKDHEKAMYFLALVCQKHEGILQSRFNGKNGHKRFEELTLNDALVYLREVFVSAGRFIATIKDKSIGDIAMGEFMDQVIPEENESVTKERFKSMRERFAKDLHEDLKHEGMMQKFASFCTQFGSSTLSGDLHVDNLRDAEKLYGKDAAIFVTALNNLHRKMQEWKEYFLRFTHGRPDFADELRAYLDSNLKVKDAIQLYGYMHRIRDAEGNLPSSLKESDAVGAFLIQMKVVQMMARRSDHWGTRMKTFLLGKGTESLLGSATIDLPPGTLVFLGQVVDIANREVSRRGYRWIQHYFNRTVAVLQELPWWGKAIAALGAGAGGAGIHLGLLHLRRIFSHRPYLNKLVGMRPEEISQKYGVDLETAQRIKNIANDALTNYPQRGVVGRQWPGLYAVRRAKAEVENLIRTGSSSRPPDVLLSTEDALRLQRCLREVDAIDTNNESERGKLQRILTDLEITVSNPAASLKTLKEEVKTEIETRLRVGRR